MWPNPQKTADLFTFTEETLNRKLRFLCSVSPETIKISNELIKSVKEAHCRFQDELEKRRKISKAKISQKSLKHKTLADEINALKEKRVKLMSEIEMLRVDADWLAVKAEKLGSQPCSVKGLRCDVLNVKHVKYVKYVQS